MTPCRYVRCSCSVYSSPGQWRTRYRRSSAMSQQCLSLELPVWWQHNSCVSIKYLHHIIITPVLVGSFFPITCGFILSPLRDRKVWYEGNIYHTHPWFRHFNVAHQCDRWTDGQRCRCCAGKHSHDITKSSVTVSTITSDSKLTLRAPVGVGSNIFACMSVGRLAYIGRISSSLILEPSFLVLSWPTQC